MLLPRLPLQPRPSCFARTSVRCARSCAKSRKCYAAEVGLHNKWVKCTHKSKMALELCRRAGKVALTMEKNKCARLQTRCALGKRASKVALSMCKRTSKRLETRAALASRAGKVALNMCIEKKKMYKEKALACSTKPKE